jgi:proteic killer suppression protein
MVKQVVISKAAQKQLRRVPGRIRAALMFWAEQVAAVGLAEVRKVSGYHDEPLRGDRAGQRSIRLSQGWRAFYVEHEGKVHFVEVIEVNHHDY